MENNLLHFLAFLCLLFMYYIYQQGEEIKQLNNNLDKAGEIIIKQDRAIQAQNLYLQLLNSSDSVRY